MNWDGFFVYGFAYGLISYTGFVYGLCVDVVVMTHMTHLHDSNDSW